MSSIHFLDVTNRDGVQTARTGLSKFGKVMVNFYLGRLGAAQSEIGFPFLFHEVPYVRACLALAEAGAFGDLRLSGWCRAVPADVAAAVAVRAPAGDGGGKGSGLRHYNLSISTSDQMIAHKFRGKLDRAAIIEEMTASVAVASLANRSLMRCGESPPIVSQYLTRCAPASPAASANSVRNPSSVRDPSSAFTPIVTAPPAFAAATAAVISLMMALRSSLPRNLCAIIWSEVEIDRL